MFSGGRSLDYWFIIVGFVLCSLFLVSCFRLGRLLCRFFRPFFFRRSIKMSVCTFLGKYILYLFNLLSLVSMTVRTRESFVFFCIFLHARTLYRLPFRANCRSPAWAFCRSRSSSTKSFTNGPVSSAQNWSQCLKYCWPSVSEY